MNPITGPDPNPILVRYFAGQESLETAATELAKIFKESMRARELGQPPTLRDFPTEPALRDHQGGNAYKLMEADVPKLRALMERVEAKLNLINQGAREYLNSASSSAFDNVVRLLADDVTATLGERHVPVVWSFAARVRQRDREDSSGAFVEDVQQYFQDTFVDTTWPACPRHPNHPLDFADGSWRCPRDSAVVARLGELPRRPGSGA